MHCTRCNTDLKLTLVDTYSAVLIISPFEGLATVYAVGILSGTIYNKSCLQFSLIWGGECGSLQLQYLVFTRAWE